MKQDGKETHNCNKCNRIRPIMYFYKAAWCKGGYRPTCIECREKDYLKRKFNVTPEWFLENSKNGCQLCSKSKSTRFAIKGTMQRYRLNIDHCHTSGKTRGVLCSQCNFTLGKYFDNLEMFNKVMKYLGKIDESQ